ncbi:MAG: S8 family serine peptidase, partial [Candidatus Competibacteraceae bacterium]
SDAHAQARGRWAEDRVLVQFRAGLPQKEQEKILKAQNGRAVGRIEQIGVHLVQVPPQALEAVTRALARNPHVEFVEKDMLVEPGFTPNDPDYSKPWHLPKIAAPSAWDWNPTMGASITIAILDTGVDATHPDLAGQIVPGWNFYDNNADTSDTHNHGTWVAGTAAATTNNGTGVASVAGQARIMPVRIAQPDGYAYWSTVAKGVTWAADQGAKIANISYNGVSGSSSVQNAAQHMRNKGGVVVVAAGNSGGQENISASDTMLSVAATNSSDTRSSFSSYGAYVDLAAPGESILTTARGGGYSNAKGTSFSSPIVAGVAALVMDANSMLSPPEIDGVLQSTAVDLGAAGWDAYYGHGRIDAAAAVAKAVKLLTSDIQAPVASITSPKGGATVSGLATVDVSATDNVGVTRVELYVNGQKIPEDDIIAPYGFSWDTTTMADGSATLVAYAYDAAGNQGFSSGVTVTVSNAVSAPEPTDTQAPTASITSPTGGATVSGVTAVGVSATDNVGVTRVDLYANNKLVASDTTSPYDFTWDTSKVADGSTTLTAVAHDAAGNPGQSSQVTVTVSNPVSAPDPATEPALTLTGTSTNSGNTWIATVTLNGPAGASTAGSWSLGKNTGECTIASGQNRCSFSLSGIRKNVSSVTYTDKTNNLAVTIGKP